MISLHEGPACVCVQINNNSASKCDTRTFGTLPAGPFVWKQNGESKGARDRGEDGRIVVGECESGKGRQKTRE